MDITWSPSTRSAPSRAEVVTEKPESRSIPSRADIIARLQSKSLANVKGPSLEDWTRPVFRVDDRLVLKCGPFIQLSEAETMRFVEQHTDVKLPHVYDAWEEEGQFDDDSELSDDESVRRERWGFILMDYVPGQNVEEVWSEADETLRDSIVAQTFDSIRRLQAGGELTAPGPIGGGHCKNDILFSMDGCPSFTDVDHLESWFDNKLRVCKAFGSVHLSTPPFKGEFRKLGLCHLDVAPRNLILRNGGELVLIDWGWAGAFPPVFQAFATKSDCNEMDFLVNSEAGFVVTSECRGTDFASRLYNMLHAELTKSERATVDKLGMLAYAMTTGSSCVVSEGKMPWPPATAKEPEDRL